ARPFDPASWQALGKRVLNSADIEVKPTDIDPAFLAKLKIDAPYRATAFGKIHLDEGADKITVETTLRDIVGGVIKAPISAKLTTTIDDTGVGVVAGVRSRNAQLLKIEAKTPLTLETLDNLKDGKITGSIDIPQADAATFVAVIGRGDVVGGKVDGHVEIAGTIGKPTANGSIALTDVVVAPAISGRKTTPLKSFRTSLAFDGQVADVTITGEESKNSKLQITVHADTKKLTEAIATIDATSFDIAPATAFAPGAASAAKGIIDAHLRLNGLDPTSGDLGGTFAIKQGRYPLSPLLGTLRNVEASLFVVNHGITIKNMKGKLGKGDISVTGGAEFSGVMPKKIHADIAIKDVSLVRAFQPTIGAEVNVTLENQNPAALQLTGDITVSKAHVAITTNEGTKLLPTGTPDDMVFVDEGNLGTLRLGDRLPPTKPWLLADITIKPTQLEILQEQFQIRGSASGNLQLSLGQGSVGLDGKIEATRGDIDLLGSRSQLERGEVVFDGTVDPLLNVRLTRDLDNMQVTAEVSGRASKPEINMSSDTGEYTQGELYAYFLGGKTGAAQAGGDVQQAGEAAGAGYASALLSKQINDHLGKFLPVRLDINYQVATATSTYALQFGSWVSPKLFLAVRGRPEARVDENSAEGIAEYHLRGSTVLEGQYGNNGYDSLDIVRRWNW
ncbi:MAG TPA: translocation/assembly module TamB domain-containing protein, partial [Kofleriaceae bacterium]